jgi:phosphoglycerate dehydrogenase-like enzyme
VNAGRGDTLDQDALVRALSENRLAAAVLDVFPEEPLPEGHVLWRTPRVYITGHTAAPSFPSDIVAVFVDNYRRFERGEPLRCQVDFERGY